MLRDQRGQTIAAVIMVMIIALSVGVAVSTRFIKSLRIVSRTDASSRAYAVAEAAVERMLNKDYDTLIDYINFGSCGADCTLRIVGADGVTATANVVLSLAGGSSEPYLVSLKEEATIEVNLQGYPDTTDLNVCWDNPPEGELPAVTALLLHGTDGNYQADAFSYNSIGSIYGANGFDEAVAGFGYAHCALISGVSDMVSVRIRSIYNDVNAYVISANGVDLPSQGVLITSTGTVLEAQRKVEVVISNPFVPLPFDYALYAKSGSVSLSN